MPSVRRALVLGLLASGLAVSGCGAGGDEAEIRAIIQEIASDNTGICDHATERVLNRLGSAGAAECRRAAAADPSRNRETIEGNIDVNVDGDIATADFKDNRGTGQHVQFIKVDGEWKVDVLTS